ncbi:hypothetical protein DFP73DRAFT_538834 [Morchella snyderi]|nr:hypothetical protein DFP73DRAFT_538834 [Morchella snyderi]
MSFNQSTGSSPPDSRSAESLENQLRGMILTNNRTVNPRLSAPVQSFTQSPGFSHETPLHQQRQSVPLFGDFSSVSAPTDSFQSYPGQYPVSQPQPPQPPQPPGLQATNTNLASPTGLHFPPAQYTGLQSQNLNMNISNTTGDLGNIPPQMGQQYRTQTQPPPQQNTPPRQRNQPPQMTAGRDFRSPSRGQRRQGFNKPQNAPRALPLNAPDHFPPLGTQPTKVKTPPPNYAQQQQSTAAKPQQRTQYQPLPIDTRNTNPQHVRGEAHGRRNLRDHYNQRQQQRDIGPEVCQYLSELSKKVIAEAAPPESEMVVKHALLERLEAISKTIVPDAKLIAFGSLVTGFATANSDLDVIFTGGDRVDILTESSGDPSSNFRIPILLDSKLQEEGFSTTLLTKTRVPILKLVQKATEQSPYELQCDIGFSNHLALYNTQMLLTYSKCDPRVKEMMIFIKWWAKRRHINNPYRGTLSSYGYALIVLHYLINVIKPPVLPNLQTFPVPDDAPTSEIIFEGDSDDTFEIWFYKDIEKLPKSDNAMDIGELLKGFFEYYASGFQWGREVVSIRTKGGLMSKQEKGWVAAVIRPGRTENTEVKNRYLFAVEDPFETEHNVSRTCNSPGVNRIKEEFRRAVWLTRVRDGGKTLFENLCMEAPPERAWVRREDRDRRGAEEAGGDRNKNHQRAEGEA